MVKISKFFSWNLKLTPTHWVFCSKWPLSFFGGGDFLSFLGPEFFWNGQKKSLSYFHFIFCSPFWCDRNRRSTEWHRQQRWQPIVSSLLRIQNLGQPRPKIAHQFSAETFQSWQREYSVELPASGTSDQSIDGTNSQYQPTINSYP